MKSVLHPRKLQPSSPTDHQNILFLDMNETMDCFHAEIQEINVIPVKPVLQENIQNTFGARGPSSTDEISSPLHT